MSLATIIGQLDSAESDGPNFDCVDTSVSMRGASEVDPIYDKFSTLKHLLQ